MYRFWKGLRLNSTWLYWRGDFPYYRGWILGLYYSIISWAHNDYTELLFEKKEIYGIPQGGILSTFLFNLFLLPLFYLIQVLLGVRLDGVFIEPLISFVDDLMYYFKFMSDLEIFRTLLSEFTIISGLVVNESKTFIINATHSDFPSPTKFKYLGIHYISNTGLPDWELLLEKISKDIKVIMVWFRHKYYWETACIINTFILPKLKIIYSSWLVLYTTW